MKKIVFILSMHRSGSSAIAGSLTQLGFHPGNELIGVDKFNKKGHFENKKIVNVNESILHLFHASWDKPYMLPDKWWDDTRLDEYQDQLIDILHTDYHSSDLSLIKDPRIAILWPWYKKILEIQNIQPLVIFIFRAPQDVAHSLKRRNAFTEDKCYYLWQYYNQSAITAGVNESAYSLSFAQLISNYSDLMSSLCVWFETNGLRIDEVERHESFIEKTLVHHHAKTNQGVQKNRLFEELIQLSLGNRTWTAVHDLFVSHKMSPYTPKENLSDIGMQPIYFTSRISAKKNENEFNILEQFVFHRSISLYELSYSFHKSIQEEVYWQPIIGFWSYVRIKKIQGVKRNNEGRENLDFNCLNGSEIAPHTFFFQTGNPLIHCVNATSYESISISFEIEPWFTERIESQHHEQILSLQHEIKQGHSLLEEATKEKQKVSNELQIYATKLAETVASADLLQEEIATRKKKENEYLHDIKKSKQEIHILELERNEALESTKALIEEHYTLLKNISLLQAKYKSLLRITMEKQRTNEKQEHHLHELSERVSELEQKLQNAEEVKQQYELLLQRNQNLLSILEENKGELIAAQERKLAHPLRKIKQYAQSISDTFFASVELLSLTNIRHFIKALRNEPWSHVRQNMSNRWNTELEKNKTEPEVTFVESNIEFFEHDGERLVINGWLASKLPFHSLELVSKKGHPIGQAKFVHVRSDVYELFPDHVFPNRPGFEIDLPLDSSHGKVRLELVGKQKKRTILWQSKWHSLFELPKFNVTSLYDEWVNNNTLSPQALQQLSKVEQRFDSLPRISIVVPVYNVEEKWLTKAVDSIRAQTYSQWELCLCDDASTADHIWPLLQKLAAEDERIKCMQLHKNSGISAATNEAITHATGNYILFMDNDDELAPHALFDLAQTIHDDPSLDIIYSDEDKISPEGKRYDPWFKPDFSPELLLSYNYFNHLTCVRASLIEKVGMLRPSYDGCQDYDLMLRLQALHPKVGHISKVLYHWRALESSIAGDAGVKDQDFGFIEKCKSTLTEYLNQQQISFERIYQPSIAQKTGAGLFQIEWPDNGPDVTIIIPSKNHHRVLSKAISSILTKTSYQNYSILIVDNESDQTKTLKYLSTIQDDQRIKVSTIGNEGKPFSFSRINNLAVKEVKSEFIVFLNDDTEVINEKWLSNLLGVHQLPGVSISGAALLYPDNTVQHAGILMDTYPHGYPNLPDHAFKGLDQNDASYNFYLHSLRNYGAVTAACMAIRKTEFESLGGFCEEHMNLAYNDVDLCCKAVDRGGRVVYVPNSKLYHYESKSRGNELRISEVVHYKNKWKHILPDQFYNENLSKEDLYTISPLRTKAYPSAYFPRKKVAFFSHNLNLEGAPIQLYEVIKGLKTTDEFDILVLSPKDGPIKNWYESDGIQVEIYTDPLSYMDNATRFSTQLDHISSLLQQHEVHGVVTNTLLCFYGILVAQSLSLPTISIIHESATPKDFFTPFPAFISKMAIPAFWYPYAQVFVSKSTRDLFTLYNAKKNQVVINNGLLTDKIDDYIASHNPDDVREQLSITHANVALNLGTVCQRKGQLDFIQAAIQFLQHTPKKDWLFILVGARRTGEEGKYLHKIEHLIAESGLSSHFRIVEETKDVFAYYMAADLFVCSSYNESYPRVILEAMAFGLPIISTPVFGITEQIIEYQNGLFYPPGDIKRLRHQIEEISNPKLYRIFASNSRLMLDLIPSYQDMVDQYLSLIRATIQK